MDYVQRTLEFFKAITDHRWFDLKNMMTDDFRYHGPLIDPFSRDEWLAFQQAVQSAFPDWRYNFEKVEVEGNVAKVTVHITATHTKTLALPMDGVPPLPPTGKVLDMPIENAEVHFKEHLVSALKVELERKGGLPGVLMQLGME